MADDFVRISFDVPAEKALELTQLQATLGLATRADLFNNAITLLEWAAAKSSAEQKIASVDEEAKSFVELKMDCLDYAFNAAKQVRSVYGE
jgi:hypothetical protein